MERRKEVEDKSIWFQYFRSIRHVCPWSYKSYLEGKIKIIDAVDSQYRDGIYAKPNRFIWMNPTVKHDISTTSSDAGHARVTNLGFLGGILHNDPSGVDYINIFTE